jgi:hypothetical protein
VSVIFVFASFCLFLLLFVHDYVWFEEIFFLFLLLSRVKELARFDSTLLSQFAGLLGVLAEVFDLKLNACR